MSENSVKVLTVSVMLIEVSTIFQKGSDSQCYAVVSTILRNVQSIEKSVFPQQPSYQGNSQPTDSSIPSKNNIHTYIVSAARDDFDYL